jgi:hypothetical protein
MGRHSKRASVTEAVTRYLRLAEENASDLYPVEVGHIARMAGCARSTLYNYGLNQLIVETASRLELKNLHGKTKEDALHALRSALLVSEAQNRALLERLVLVEANAVRLGIDADELYRPLLKPARRVPAKRRGR